MGALSVIRPTLMDVSSRLDPDGNIDTIVEILSETNEVLQDATFIEGNLPTGHRSTQRTGIPEATFRKMNGGVQPGKSRTQQITDNCGMLEAYAEIDKALADLNGNTNAFRLSEDTAHIEGMNQKFSDYLFYGDETTAPEAFTGIAPRFNSLASAENSCNVLTGSGSSDLTSIYLVGWGANTAHCIYPKGSKAGLAMTNKGQVTIEDVDGSGGGRMEAYRTHYKWDVGLTVRDWRYIVRICNIDYTALIKNAATGADLFDLMAQALELLPSQNMGTPVFYCNRTIKSFLRRQQLNKVASSTLAMEDVAGRKVMAIDGVPIKRCDAITNAETVVA